MEKPFKPAEYGEYVKIKDKLHLLYYEFKHSEWDSKPEKKLSSSIIKIIEENKFLKIETEDELISLLKSNLKKISKKKKIYFLFKLES